MYELILQGVKSESQQITVAEKLRKRGALPKEGLVDALSTGPLTIEVSLSRDSLLPLYREIKRSGGKVSIVRYEQEERREVKVRPTVAIECKRKSLQELQALSTRLRREEKRLVLVHGVFDILHIGHIRLLNHARELGDVVIVTVVADTSVGRGPGSPFFHESLRMEALANLEAVDFVTVIDSGNAVSAIQAIKPDYIVRGHHPTREKFDFKGEQAMLEDQAIRKVGGRSVSIGGANYSSSKLSQMLLEIYPEATAAFLADFAARWTFDQIAEQIERCRQLKVLVIGDTIVDRYHYCQPLGKSAKENIIVNKSSHEEDFAGGIIATANHVAQICEHVDVITCLGAQDSHEQFIREKLSTVVRPQFFFRESGPTTVKKRYVNPGSNQKLFEVCDLNDRPLSATEEQRIAAYLNEALPSYDLVVINDFGHGMLTPTLIQTIVEKSKSVALNVQVNGANQGFNLVTNYSKADFVCIDDRELRLATRDNHGAVDVLMKKVADLLSARHMIATQGGSGSKSFSRSEGFCSTPAFATSSVDKVGAGDAFFAYTAPCFAAGVPQELIGFIGNCVGALKVQIVGNREQVRLSDLMRFIERLLK